MRIGMKHPEAFSRALRDESCCLMNDPQRLLPGAAANQPRAVRWPRRSPHKPPHGPRTQSTRRSSSIFLPRMERSSL